MIYALKIVTYNKCPSPTHFYLTNNISTETTWDFSNLVQHHLKLNFDKVGL